MNCSLELPNLTYTVSEHVISKLLYNLSVHAQHKKKLIFMKDKLPPIRFFMTRKIQMKRDKSCHKYGWKFHFPSQGSHDTADTLIHLELSQLWAKLIWLHKGAYGWVSVCDVSKVRWVIVAFPVNNGFADPSVPVNLLYGDGLGTGRVYTNWNTLHQPTEGHFCHYNFMSSCSFAD